MKIARVLLVVGLTMVWNLCAGSTIDEIITNATNSSHPSPPGTEMLEQDMVFPDEELAKLRMDQDAPDGLSKRKASNYEDHLWPYGDVPYVVHNDLRSIVEVAIQDYTKYTCIQFRPRTNADKNYIDIIKDNGCWSYLGMTGGRQRLSLGWGCNWKTVTLHELGHAIGFYHEQSRPDRDTYVRINPYNFDYRLYEDQFRKMPTSVINTRNVPYDYYSIMHYGQFAFSKNRQPTIITTDPDKQDTIGNQDGLSFLDIKLANIIYSCSSHCESKTCPGAGYLDKNCNCQCPGNPISPCDTGNDENLDDCKPRKDYGLYFCTTKCGSNNHCDKKRNMVCRCDGDCGPSCVNPVWLTKKTGKPCKEPLGPPENGAIENKERPDDDSFGLKTLVHYSCDDGFQLIGDQERICRRNGKWGGQAPTCDQACKDLNKYCFFWSSKGYCWPATYKAYMEENCAHSCNICGGGVACKDLHKYCGFWSSKGYCWNATYKAYMELNCAHSCNICGGGVGDGDK